MGICCSCCVAQEREPVVPALLLQYPSTEQTQDNTADPDVYHEPSTIHNYLAEGDSSFLGSKNFSGNSWFSMVTTNFTARISHVSGALAARWDNNAGEGTTLPAALAETLPEMGTITIDSKLRAFTFAEMKAATINFRPNMVLGVGGFGKVYKGWLKENGPYQVIRKRAIAIKRLDANSKQGLRQWQTEVGFLGKLSHPNIVKLLGYCRENNELLIVYEFMPKGSLNYHLFGRRSNSNSTLPWDERVKIIIGMARGLCHLHEMEKPIIYRDFKSSNILLNDWYAPKLSDFGLAKWGPTDNSSIKGHIMGTVGYADPEYVGTGNLYVKSDVYSFGVVLVEMLTGLQAIDKKRQPSEDNLVSCVEKSLLNKSKLKHIMDKRLEGKYSIKEASAIADVAARCLNQITKHRPSMKEVVETLKKLEARYRKSVK